MSPGLLSSPRTEMSPRRLLTSPRRLEAPGRVERREHPSRHCCAGLEQSLSAADLPGDPLHAPRRPVDFELLDRVSPPCFHGDAPRAARPLARPVGFAGVVDPFGHHADTQVAKTLLDHAVAAACADLVVDDRAAAGLCRRDAAAERGITRRVPRACGAAASRCLRDRRRPGCRKVECRVRFRSAPPAFLTEESRPPRTGCNVLP